METEQRIRLPIRVLPAVNESIWGWAVRVTELNGYFRPYWILKEAGVLRRGGLKRRSVLSRLSELVDGSWEVFDSIVPNTTVRGGRGSGMFFGLGLPSWMMDSRRPKVCPRCLEERHFIQQSWELAFWSCCPIHKCRMLTKCPKCGSAINWNRGRIDYCEKPGCGGRFSAARATQASGPEIAMVEMISESVGLGEAKDGTICGLSLRDLSPDAVIRTIAGVALAAGRATSELRPREISMNAAVIRVTANALSDWPHGFHRLLAEQENESENQLCHRFKNLYPGLCNNQSMVPEAVKKVFRNEVSKYLGEDVSHETGTIDQNDRGRTSQWLTRVEVSRAFGISVVRVNNIVRQEKLQAKRFERTGGLLIDRNELERFDSGRRADEISMVIAARLLGIHFNTAKRLVDAGFVRQICRPHRNFISRSSVKELLARVSASVDGRQAECELTLSDMSRNYKSTSMEEFIETILSGNLRATRINRKGIGLQRVLFNKQDVERCVKLSKLGRKVIDRKMAHQMLHARIKDVRRLLESGDLSPAAENSKDYGVCLDSVRAFCQRFATIGVLARQYSTTAWALEAKLRLLGLTPYLESDGPHSCAFWSRTSVAETLTTVYKAAV